MKQGDLCPGYWWAEQMKYYYLLFSDTPRFDYRNNYLSTEGKVLGGIEIKPRNDPWAGLCALDDTLRNEMK